MFFRLRRITVGDDNVNMTTVSHHLPGALVCLAGAMFLTLNFSCESGPTFPRPTGTAYRFEGALVKDLNTGFTHIRATFTRSDTLLPQAGIWFGGDSLAYLPDSMYHRAVLPTEDYPGGSYTIVIQDSTLFVDTLPASIPDTFSIQNVYPATRRKTVYPVRVEWYAAAGAGGYVIATAKRDSIYTGAGFSQYVTSLATSETFPDSAFFGINNQFDTGWYNLYVYAYVGAPDSALSADLLPVPLPSQLTGNLSGKNLEGRFGAVVVAALDSMHVVLEE